MAFDSVLQQPALVPVDAAPVRRLHAVEPASVVTPIRRAAPDADLADQLLLAFAAAPDVTSGLKQVVAMLCRAGGAARVEWWRPSADGTSLSLAAADGSGIGLRFACPLGPVGALVVAGDERVSRAAAVVLPRLVPVLRRRWTEERLAERAVHLARRNEALEDFAALVAHELKTPLLAALQGADPTGEVERALELVDSVLLAARTDLGGSEGPGALARCLADVLRDVDPAGVEVVSDLAHTVPMSGVALRLVLRNLLANAIAAGATHVSVTSSESAERSTLSVDDDGVGLGSEDGYAGGSGIGLSLCRRVVARFGGSLVLEPRATGGTRALIALPRSDA